MEASIIILIAVLIVCYHLFFSRMARETRELVTLNRIWERFNEKLNSPEETLSLVNSKRWKYHQDKVELLKTFIGLIKPQAK